MLASVDERFDAKRRKRSADLRFCADSPISVSNGGRIRSKPNRVATPANNRKLDATGAQIWGQTRCPIYRSGTFNVQRLTLNVKRGDRKGARWAGYGDRHDIHDIWAPGLLTRTSPSACQPVETHWGPPLPEKGDRHGAWATGLLTAGPGGAPCGRSRPAAAP
jgi:hypothetical protein